MAAAGVPTKKDPRPALLASIGPTSYTAQSISFSVKEERVACIKCGGDGVMGCDLHKEPLKQCKSCLNLAPSGKRCHACHGIGVVSAGSFKAYGSRFDGLEQEIQAICTDKPKLLALWKRIDYNGNNIVSLAEIDKLVVEKFPLLDNKPALIRAYKAVIAKQRAEKGGKQEDFVHQREFPLLLRSIFYFNRIQSVFDVMDEGDDRRLNMQEFKAAAPKVGIVLNDKDLELEFYRIDVNRGGQILFEEFCNWVANKKIPIGSDILPPAALPPVANASLRSPGRY